MTETNTTGWRTVSNGSSGSEAISDEHINKQNASVQFRGNGDFVTERSTSAGRLGPTAETAIESVTYGDIKGQEDAGQDNWEVELTVTNVTGSVTASYAIKWPVSLDGNDPSPSGNARTTVEGQSLSGGESITATFPVESNSNDSYGDDYIIGSHIHHHAESDGSVTIEQKIRKPGGTTVATNTSSVSDTAPYENTFSITVPSIDNFSGGEIEVRWTTGFYSNHLDGSNYSPRFSKWDSPKADIEFSTSGVRNFSDSVNGVDESSSTFDTVIGEDDPFIDSQDQGETLTVTVKQTSGQPFLLPSGGGAYARVEGNEEVAKSENPSVSDGGTGASASTGTLSDGNTSSFIDYSYFEGGGNDDIAFDASVGGSNRVDIRFQYDFEYPRPDEIETIVVYDGTNTIELPLVNTDDPQLEYDVLHAVVNNTELAADIVTTDDSEASSVRIQSDSNGTLAWRESQN